MRINFHSVADLLGCLVACVLMCAPPSFCQGESQYAPWGVDEYQLFGLTKAELSTKFKGKLFFSKDFERATIYESGTGLGYQGPLFKLSFTDGKVSSVQGVFEGCKQTLVRPRFETKEAAVLYAIRGLSSYTGTSEQKSLAQAQRELASLNKSRNTPKSQTH